LSSPEAAAVCATPSPPVMTHGVFGGCTPVAITCVSSLAAVVSASPLSPVSMTGVFAFLHGAPNAMSCTSSPAAIVSTILFAPQRISVRFGLPLPTAANWMSSGSGRRVADAVGTGVDHGRVLLARARRDLLLIGQRHTRE
jgi:hypothetical protein